MATAGVVVRYYFSKPTDDMYTTPLESMSLGLRVHGGVLHLLLSCSLTLGVSLVYYLTTVPAVLVVVVVVLYCIT